MKAYQGYLIDLDGTIYLGKEIIPAGKRFVEQLQQQNIPFLFVTNNTTKEPVAVARRLATEFDLHVADATIYTASLATIDYMKRANKGSKVFVIGEAGLIDLILAAGFEWDEKHPDYVIVGLDNEVNYHKLTKAVLGIQNGAMFIGTNPDKNIPTHQGLLPGAGALIAFVQAATQQMPVIIGKPNATIIEAAANVLGIAKEHLLMVGDNYETDIQAGIQNGLDTLLVLSGFTSKDALPSLKEQPTYIVDSLDEWMFTNHEK